LAPLFTTPIRRMRSGCCARAASGHAAEQRDELPPSELIELHPIPHEPGPRAAEYQIISG